MKILIALLFAAAVNGCSQQPERATRPSPKPVQSALAQDQVEKLATDFKAEWLKHNHEENKIMGTAILREVKSTATGWHVIFESVTLPGQPEGESHHFLHVYIDSKGKLEKVVRGPDEIT